MRFRDVAWRVGLAGAMFRRGAAVYFGRARHDPRPGELYHERNVRSAGVSVTWSVANVPDQLGKLHHIAGGAWGASPRAQYATTGAGK